MKVLFIGHYKEHGGWAEASKGYILAMQEAGIDVVCRNVTLTQDHDPGKEILKLEKKSTDNSDFCIQHLLPHHLVGTNKFKKNISIVDLESVSIKDLTWFEHLKLVDEIWVPNKSLSNSLKDFKTRVVHHCSDIEKYTKKYQEIDIPEARGCFKFYYIGDWNDRKNIGAIIRSFHSEFDPSENVRLVFKINKFGYDPAKLQAEFDRFLQEHKKLLRMYPDNRYIKDIIITERLTEEQLYSIHQHCDCFICPSHGEAWSIPSFDAMAFGNTPICTDFGGPSEFIDKNNSNTGSLIPFNFASCVCSDAAFPEIFTGREYWAQPCEMKIRQAMRYYYENKDKLACKKAGLTRAMNYSFEKVGKQIKEILNELTNS
jgi:glycosyltransferase involved in cell wall biosynthesis